MQNLVACVSAKPDFGPPISAEKTKRQLTSDLGAKFRESGCFTVFLLTPVLFGTPGVDGVSGCWDWFRPTVTLGQSPIPVSFALE